MLILVTGGAGYIGSHAVVELMLAGYDVVVLDNLSNSHGETLQNIGRIVGQEVVFTHGDVRDESLLTRLFEQYSFEAVVHFAGLKAVGESVSHPLRYYENNVAGSLTLLRVMEKFNVRQFVFSSSATVYGNPAVVPVPESSPISTTNPYGTSKAMVEGILRDLSHSDPEWRVAILRYFNPVGAHPSGLIGEHANGVPNNLMPYIAQVAAGQREYLSVFGSDYATVDGTGVRDYIHVVDLVIGHLRALEFIGQNKGILTCNLGTGQGYSVLQMLNAFELATGHKVPYRLVNRRPGDVDSCYADPAYAEKVLKWRAERSIVQMCQDSWRWQEVLTH